MDKAENKLQVNPKGFLQVGALLRLEDKISLVFLLCSRTEISYHTIRNLLDAASQAEQDGLFRQFMLELMVDEFDTKIILEALAIIQNFRAGRILGFTKKEMLTLKEGGLVNPVRKQLYFLAESLNEKETNKLFASMSGTDSKKKYCFLEEAILDWQIKGAHQVGTDLDSCSLKTINDYLKTCQNTTELRVETSSKDIFDKEDAYNIIDPKNLGYCVVINNATFTENNELAHLMPPQKLTPRPGSERDVEAVREVFSWLNFQVCVHDNVTYTELRDLLSYYGKQITHLHSCFVLVVMSHGTEDVIYSSDSVPISVEALEMAFQRNNCPLLSGKPKILIIQACQGSDFQKVMVDSVQTPATLDSLIRGPERGDALIAWSTVKGYSSFRDRFEGSWFIQELCKELKASADTKDLVDIVTRVNNSLRSKTFHGLFMVPSVSFSLCKKIRLVP